jgi:competence protein ComEC
LPDGKLRLVFCDVGQGDGIYIGAPGGEDILIDGGPNRKILECLGRNMPFWDKRVEIVVLTHPQADHLNGLIDVLERYKVGYFVTSPIGNETKGYRKLKELIEEKGVSVRNVYTGDKIKLKTQSSKFKTKPELPITNYQLPRETEFRVLWPSRKFIAENISAGEKITYSDKHVQTFLSNSVLGVSTAHKDLNDFSVVLELKFGEFEALLGGDADEGIQGNILAANSWDIGPVEVFKVPHHGSKYGILKEYLDEVEPIFAVVSVGKNRWGHPDKSILEKLEVRGLRIWRTDKNGDVKFTTDGKQIWVESDRN